MPFLPAFIIVANILTIHQNNLCYNLFYFIFLIFLSFLEKAKLTNSYLAITLQV